MSEQNLWAPWRLSYIESIVGQPSDGAATHDGGCFLCAAAQTSIDDNAARERLVLVNDDRGVLLLNRYPYTNGHLLIAPHDHVAALNDLSPAARAGLMELATLGSRLVEAAMNPQGRGCKGVGYECHELKP